MSDAPVVARPVLKNWAAAAVTPMNTNPTTRNDSDIEIDPTTGYPATLKITAEAAQMSSSVALTTTIDAVVGAWRPTGFESTSSTRSVSSSALVCRFTRKMLISASAIIPHSWVSFTRITPIVG